MDQSKSVRRSALLVVGVLCCLHGGPGLDAQSTSGMGPLRRHSSNPRCFADASGKAVYLTGSHHWNNLQDRAGSPTFDYTAYLNFMQQHNHNFMRMWAWEERATPPLYSRTGPGNALDGGLKYNTNQLNQAYFDRLRSRVIAARDRGIYVSIMLFQGWSIEWKQAGYNQWPSHYFNVNNNINGINGDPNNDGNGREVHMLSVPQVTALQDAYVRKVVDTVNDLDNVLYEITNESHYQSVDWQYHMINLLHNYEAGKPKRHPVGMTGLGFADPKYGGSISNVPLYNSPADWVSPWDGNDVEGYETHPPASTGAKVIIPDTDHLWGNGGNRDWVWKSFTRGLHPIFMDVTPPLGDWTLSTANDVRTAMGRTRSYALRMNLGAATPQNGLSSTAYCLASAGSEYLVYQPGSGGFTVNVAAGTYSYEWFNPVTGAVAGTGSVAAAGGNRSFTAPFSGTAVLFLKRTSTQTPALVPPTITSPSNGTVFAFGTTQATVTWNAVAGAAGYLVRCMDTGSSTNVLYLDRYTQLQVNVPVSAGRSYRFWIHSHNSSFTYSNPATWSEESVIFFSVSATAGGLAVPTITSPANGTVFASSTTQVTVRWNPVAGAAGYLVRCRDTGSNVNVLYLDRYTQTQVNVPVSAGRSYLFWVHSHTASWSYSNPSQASTEAQVRFSVSASSGGTLQIPTITAPTPNQVFPNTTTAVTIRWDAVAGAAGYLLRALDLTTGQQILYRDMYTGTSINLPVVRGHSYRFWIHAAASNFSYSNPSSFTGQANRYWSVAN